MILLYFNQLVENALLYKAPLYLNIRITIATCIPLFTVTIDATLEREWEHTDRGKTQDHSSERGHDEQLYKSRVDRSYHEMESYREKLFKIMKHNIQR